jgi:hypothetical protein
MKHINATPSQPTSWPATTEVTKAKKPDPLKWQNNCHWTDTLVEFLSNSPDFCAKLFSDSTENAMKEGCKKVVGADSKAQLYATLAQHQENIISLNSLLMPLISLNMLNEGG